MGKRWSNKETAYLKNCLRKITYKQIAKKLNRTERSIKKKVIIIGLAIKKPRWLSEEVNILKELIKKHYSYTLIGLKMRRSRYSIASKTRRLNLHKERKNDID